MVDEVTPDEVHEKLSEDDLTVVDIRSRREFERGHIPGAVNLPMNELTSRVDEFHWTDEVVVVCPIGQSSIQAARLLGSYEGIDADSVKSMEGGYDAWEYELEREEGVAVDDEDAPF